MNRGRPQQTITDTDRRRREKSAARLEALKKEKGYTYAQLEDLLHISTTALKNYRRGRRDLPIDVAEALERLTGVYYLFWQGKTDARTKREYLEECTRNADRAVNELWQATDELDKERTRFFAFLGYEYEHRHSAAIDFAGICKFTTPEDAEHIDAIRDISPSGGEHYIHNLQAPDSPHIAFTEQEFSMLIERIKYFVEYECFRQARALEHNNGNH